MAINRELSSRTKEFQKLAGPDFLPWEAVQFIKKAILSGIEFTSVIK